METGGKLMDRDSVEDWLRDDAELQRFVADLGMLRTGAAQVARMLFFNVGADGAAARSALRERLEQLLGTASVTAHQEMRASVVVVEFAVTMAWARMCREVGQMERALSLAAWRDFSPEACLRLAAAFQPLDPSTLPKEAARLVACHNAAYGALHARAVGEHARASSLAVRAILAIYGPETAIEQLDAILAAYKPVIIA